MTPQYALAVLEEDTKTVAVQFQRVDRPMTSRVAERIEGEPEYGRAYSGKLYVYLTKEDFEVGDYAVVSSPYSGFAVVRVVEVHASPQISSNEERNLKWVMGRIDIQAYKREQEAYQNRLSEVRKRMMTVTRKPLREQIVAQFGDLLEAPKEGQDNE